MSNWYLQNGKDSDVVISSRIRLSRNLEKYPFTSRCTEKDFQEILNERSEERRVGKECS